MRVESCKAQFSRPRKSLYSSGLQDIKNSSHDLEIILTIRNASISSHIIILAEHCPCRVTHLCVVLLTNITHLVKYIIFP